MMASATLRLASCSLRIFSSTVFWQISLQENTCLVTADAVCAVRGLAFDGRVPPRVIVDNVIGAGKVEASAAGLERDQGRSGFPAKLLKRSTWSEPVRFCAIQIAERHLPENSEPLPDYVQHLHKLRKDQHLVAAFHNIHGHILEGIGTFAAGQIVGKARQIHLEQARMTADLARNLREGVQNGHLAPGRALFIHIGQHLRAELPGQHRVKLAWSLLEGRSR